jgi:predicted enzyme related to lactoylglutathione lyase
MSRPHGLFAWHDLLTTDVEKAKAFFTATLGWSYENYDLADEPYFIIRSGDEMVGGLAP